MEMQEKRLILRNEVVAYMKPKKIDSETFEDKYYLLEGFTELNETANIQEYTRKYVNEASERTNATGMNKQYSFNLDFYDGDIVHADIKNMYDKEKLGSDTEREFLSVETYKEIKFTDNVTRTEKTGKKASMRKYSIIISDRSGDQALTYSGTCNSAGKTIDGVATSDDNWQTVTFTPIENITINNGTDTENQNTIL